MRAAIYARFSTDLQTERSVEDQVDLCQSYCAREGLTVYATFADRARSGASIIGRDGLLSLIAQAKEKAFDVVVVEALDRLSRDMEDLAGLYKRLAFAGIEIRAVHEGRADTVTVGLRGLVGQLFREDGAKKIRRGMAGVVRDGRHAGGRAYGYRPIAGAAGRLEIVEEEAAIVRRIFDAYAAGAVPREIAATLNREGVAAPRGVRWNASTINGNAARGNGILFNELYMGRIVWNKVRMVKHPDTGRRISRPNVDSEWSITDVPDLRIIDDATWRAARARKEARAALHGQIHLRRRPQHMLSGLLRCGICGGGVSIHDRGKTGRPRLRCSAVRESGSCTNQRRYALDRVESAVLGALRDNLTDPRLLDAFLHAYNRERAALAHNGARDRALIETGLHDAQAVLDRVLDAVVKGLITDEEAVGRLPPLRAERDRLRAALAAAEAPPAPVRLHPAAVQAYLRDIEAIAAADREGEIVEPLRRLVQSVTLHPTAAGFDIEIKGRLSQLACAPVFPEGVGISVVAVLRYHRYPHADGLLFTLRSVA